MKQHFKLPMNYCLLSLSLALLLLIGLSASAQDTIPIRTKVDDSELQQKLENIAESTETEDGDYADLVEGLVFYKEHPINLNRTTREELARIQLLNDIQINKLLTHIDKTGNLISIYELQGIDGFDLQTIRKILPYVYVTNNFTTAHFGIKEMFRNGSNTILLRYGQVLEKQTGFDPFRNISFIPK